MVKKTGLAKELRDLIKDQSAWADGAEAAPRSIHNRRSSTSMTSFAHFFLSEGEMLSMQWDDHYSCVEARPERHVPDEVSSTSAADESSDDDDDDIAMEMEMEQELDAYLHCDSDAAVDGSASEHRSSGTCEDAALASTQQRIRELEEQLTRAKEHGKCCICWDARACIVTLPCAHMVQCLGCFRHKREGNGSRHVCPMCRAEVLHSFPVYVN